MAAIITNIDPTTLEVQNYSLQDINLIPVEETPSQFDPSQNYVEYTILSPDQSFQITDQNFINYRIINDPSPSNSSVVYSVDIEPEQDLIARGFTNGEYNAVYNFLNNELSSSSDNRVFYIKDISPDRTEIKITSNTLSNTNIETSVNDFKIKLASSIYFQDFYLNFGSNQLIIANNILLDNTKPQYEILINLYEALPSQFRLKDTLWVVTQVADPLAFNIQFQPEVIIPKITNPTIKGPNFDLPLKDRINNSSNYINYAELLTTGLASSYQQITSYLNDPSIAIGVDYSNFSEFIHFSSAESRIENFYYKIQLIEQYNSDITTLGTSESSSISSSVSILQDKIDNIIKNFDGYEYWLYFNTGSTTYPKGTTTPPYIPLSSNDTIVITWYNDLIESASIYDQNNQDYLVNTIPDYLRDDPQNEPYKVFIDMIGQHYDNIWLYYKDVTNRYNGDNRLDFGISKDLVADALRSFGLKIYQNNFSTSDLYNAFTGFNIVPSSSFSSSVDGNVYVVSPYIVEGDYGYFLDDITYYPGDPTELITNYITASQAALYEPIDDINKEVYKRLYHNLPLLLKQKGTVAGLRNLINVYGIPDTILRISEFGGRDKDTSTYDYFQNRYSYAFKTYNKALVSFPWQPLKRNYLDSNELIVPDCIQFRFKTEGIPTTNPYTQSLLLNAKNSIPIANVGVSSFGILLFYSGSGTGSYSGSVDPYEKYGTLQFYISGGADVGSEHVLSPEISLPFFDGGWWSVMLQRNQHVSMSVSSSNTTYTLYAANKIYDNEEGNTIGFIASSSIYVDGTNSSSLNASWNDSRTAGTANTWIDTGVRLGSNFNSIVILRNTGNILIPANRVFSGSFQEFRYYASPLSESQFRNYVMNPESIDGLNNTGSLSSFDILAFRAPLGNELESQFTSSLLTYSSSSLTSLHPAITGAANLLITESFLKRDNITLSSSNYFIYFSASAQTQSYYETNVEMNYLDQPIVGLRNRTTDKIQIISQSLPQINLEYSQSGNTLSQYINIQQQYVSDQSEIPDVNALEVAFSPTNEIDDDIIASLGYFNIGEYIGDPRQILTSDTSYPDLNVLAMDHFKKYYDRYDLFDYIRLIKFFDNSLFKMIKDFVPARTNLRSGVVVKQHILERNKYPQPTMDTYQVQNANIYSSSAGLYEVFNYAQDLTLTGSIDTAFFSGSTGGTFNEFNNISSLQSNYLFAVSGGFASITYGSSNTQNYFQVSSSNSNIINYFPTEVIEWNIESGSFTTYFNGVIKVFYSASDTNIVVYEFSSSYRSSPNATAFDSASWLTECNYGEEFFIRMYDFTLNGPSASVEMVFGVDGIYSYSQQTWPEFELGPTGSTYLIREDQREFYNGELPGTVIEASNGELNEANVFKYPSTLEIDYNIVFYKSNITPLDNFTNINTSPNQGEIYLWWDSGSIIYPAGVPGGVQFSLTGG